MNVIERMREIDEKECPVDVLLQEVRSHKCGDCGKCVFGYEGITQLEVILNDITLKKAKSTDIALMQDLCGMMHTEVICDDGKEIAAAVLETMDKYKEDFANHVSKKSCRAGKCKKFMTYHILADQCIGCGDCLDVCEEDAILGKKKFVHVIDQDECTQCGKCMEECGEDAIVLAGAVKPRCPKKPVPCKRK